ncbi:MAG: reductive dehalogenase [Deltaproteobacteria bacterium]|nr:reductive dehalogenase [Deltaproteobacteria bacterium]MBW2129205.1 reductive dehalogenase [Deltaproteobacteria bacterium]
MKVVNEPTYKKYITGELKRFDDRNTAFSRGHVEGNKYTAMHEKGITNMLNAPPGQTILDHATSVAGGTVDYVVRMNLLGREMKPIYNDGYRLKDPDPAAMSRVIKEKAKWIGADDVGIARINPLWIYSHWGHHNVKYSQAAEVGDPIELPSGYKFVIVMLNELAHEVIQRSPAVEYETDISYSKGVWCAASLATFITELGYRAIPTVNEIGINVAMAVDAGLGEMGRSGQLITRDYGPRVRISKVFTDLPLIPDRPVDIGVQEFCEKCAICAQYCPSEAIPMGERTDRAWDECNSPGMLKWPIHAMKCFDWWVKNGNHCSICIRVCPWNKPNDALHKGVRFFAERNILTRLIVRMDQMMGYGKQVVKDGPVKDCSVERKKR